MSMRKTSQEMKEVKLPDDPKKLIAELIKEFKLQPLDEKNYELWFEQLWKNHLELYKSLNQDIHILQLKDEKSTFKTPLKNLKKKLMETDFTLLENIITFRNDTRRAETSTLIRNALLSLIDHINDSKSRYKQDEELIGLRNSVAFYQELDPSKLERPGISTTAQTIKTIADLPYAVEISPPTSSQHRSSEIKEGKTATEIKETKGANPLKELADGILKLFKDNETAMKQRFGFSDKKESKSLEQKIKRGFGTLKQKTLGKLKKNETYDNVTKALQQEHSSDPDHYEKILANVMETLEAKVGKSNFEEIAQRQDHLYYQIYGAVYETLRKTGSEKSLATLHEKIQEMDPTWKPGGSYAITLTAEVDRPEPTRRRGGPSAS